MIYIPEWVPIADALERLIATGLGEEDAKRQLCAAIADGKIRLRHILGADLQRNLPAQQVSSGLSAPVGFSPKDIDWCSSRPLRSWQSPTQELGEPVTLFIRRAQPLMVGTVELMEVYNPDVQKIFATEVSPLPADLAKPKGPENIEAGVSPVRAQQKPTTRAKRRAVQKAASALWPAGIPDSLTAKERHNKIIEWLRGHGMSVPSQRTIQRSLRDCKQ